MTGRELYEQYRREGGFDRVYPGILWHHLRKEVRWEWDRKAREKTREKTR